MYFLPLAQQTPSESPGDAAELDTLEIHDLNDATQTIIASLSSMLNDFLARLPLIAAAFLVIGLTWLAAAIADRVTRRTLARVRLRRSLKDLVRQIVYAAVWVVGLLVAAVIVFPGMTPSRVLTVFGLSSIAIGFAFKDIVENFFAGVLILWRFPFETGDFIECDGIEGAVEETTIRMTTLRQVDGQLIVLPNARLFKSPVRVMTSRRVRRAQLICGVDYGTDLAAAQQALTEALTQCELVSKDPPPEVFAREFGGSSIDFEICWWSGSTPKEQRAARDQVVQAIKSQLDNARIEIPFPHRTLTFKEPLRHAPSEADQA
ncbi:Small-conductance mechanosensitive channel [Posidoniimonas polymericola]|uniref:Small-conductance mechanosensitive channel n=1 Tax=Posidoniimonas polymericola TaxID=2528002 RepID=A0A5C5XWF3_9BACT|nr:mechanosensitive ion channel [Posidoniimonas polymericola]TWT66871.1 Small-conductance mechanosensitive channel [Posidoniimonas polymericola]